MSLTCPWWVIRSFDNPLRRRLQDPEQILAGLVQEGFRCLDVGCGYGYFTIPMAHLAGESGSVTALDIQHQMLKGVERRAVKAGLSNRIQLVCADASILREERSYDFVLLFWMVHEVAEPKSLMTGIAHILSDRGSVLLAEPKFHVTGSEFQRTVAAAREAGLQVRREPGIFFSRTVLLDKKTT